MEFVELTTARLRLRRPVESDIDTITAICQEPEIVAFTTVPSPYRRSHAEAFVIEAVPHGWAAGTDCTWAITRRDDAAGGLLGVVSIHDVEDGAGSLGYWLGAAGRGRGIMTEAVESVIDFGFARPPEGLGLRRLQWQAVPSNEASVRVAQKAGFRWEGLRRAAVLHRGRPQDLACAGLLASDSRTSHNEWTPVVPGAPGM